MKLQKKILPHISRANQKSNIVNFSGGNNFFVTEKNSLVSNNVFSNGTGFYQPKLMINQPGDHYEQEADAVADQVTRKNQQNVRLRHNPENNISTTFFGGKIIHGSFFPGETRKAKNNTQSSVLCKTESGVNITPVTTLNLNSSRSDITVNREEDNIQKEQKEGFRYSEPQTSKIFENKLSATKGNGSPLPKDTREEMESGIGADFSRVNIHTRENAVQMSSEIGARAFTHQNDIYFNQSQYQPKTSEGKHLLAHELTHTVQQGASIQTKPNKISSAQIHVQRGLLDGISSFFGGIRDKIVNFVQRIPGFFLFTVLLGRNPLTDEQVDKNGRNILKGLLLILPHGKERYKKLEQEGAIDQSAAWIDQQMATINSIRQQASLSFDRAIASLSISDVLNPGAALDRIRGYFSPVINRATNFARYIARQVLQFLKDTVLKSLVKFIRSKTRGYPLLCVLLGRDPVTNEEVPRTMENIIHAFLMLSESGEAYYNKLKESGALDRAISWMQEQIATLPSAQEVIGSFIVAWNSISFEDLFQPIAAFQRIYGILSDPIVRVLRFVSAVAMQVLILIKDAMLGWLRSNANEIPGYHLLTVILGRDVFTNEPVARNATNLIRGFMGLIPGGEEQFQQMQESGVIPRLASRIESAVDALGFTWDYIKNLFISIWQSLRITDLLIPFAVFVKIIGSFKDPIDRIFKFIRVVIFVVIEVLLRMMDFPFDLIEQIINNAKQAYEDIKRDPMGFLKNLMRAAKKGFKQFLDNFIQHLKRGVTGWIFSQMESAGLQPPKDTSFRSILGMAMEVLGITVDNIFDRLAKKIGQDKVDKIRSIADKLTGIWEFVHDVMERGAVAIWERIQEQLNNLWDIIVDGIKNWIITRIVQRVVARLLTMLDPTGIMLVVNGFITLFRAIQSLIEHITRILKIINTFVQGIGQIARGNIQQAADFLENALAGALSVAIAFLANQVGLRNLGRQVGHMIEKAREVINKGIDWLIDKALRLGGGILDLVRRGASAVRGGAARLVSWWKIRKEFKTSDQQNHTVYFQGTGPNAQLMINTTPKTVVDYINTIKSQHDLKGAVVSDAMKKAHEIDAKKQESVPEERKQAHAAEIDMLVDQLVRIILKIPLNTPYSTITEPVYGPLYGGFGTIATRAYMDNNLKGGTEAFRESTDTYKKLDKRKHGSSSYYIRGHLFNGKLGGDGETWHNLTPLFRKANNPAMYHNFEKILQKVLLNGGKGLVKDFKVVAIYDKKVDENTKKIVREVDEGILEGYPDSIIKNDTELTPEEILEYLDAERFVPGKLMCSAKYVENKSNTSNMKSLNYEVKNPTGPPYVFDITKKPKIILETISKMKKEEAIPILMKLKSIDENKAEKVYQNMQGIDWKKRVRYKDIFGQDTLGIDILGNNITKQKLHEDNPNYKIIIKEKKSR